MKNKTVRDLMIPLHEYAVVSSDATLADAVRILKQTERRLQPDRQPARAVLVADPKGMIIGQLGHLEILQALEPKHGFLSDLETLSKAGVADELIASLVDNLKFWRGELKDVCKRARDIEVSKLMRPISESIPEDTPLWEAAHKIVSWQAMRLLVTRDGRVVGVLRLADLAGEVVDLMVAGDL